MINVDSRQTLKLITNRFVRANRGRNLIAIIAIIMTTVMFTALFTATMSMLQLNQQMEMQNSMDASHIRASMLTQKQFEEIRGDERIAKYGHTIYLAAAEDLQLGNFLTELQYADENGAKGCLSNPTKGRMPSKYNEVAMSTVTLDLLGVPHKTGSKVKLTFTASGRTQTAEFVLCGYWKGEQTFVSQPVWVSKSFCLKHCGRSSEQSIRDGNLQGAYSLAIWCDNQFQLPKYVEEMDAAYGISKSQADIAVNTAYEIFGNDGFPFDAAAILLLIIFAAGYFIIFNVFQISVKRDIQSYGLLKNVGTTGRQLKSIVRRQAMLLSVIGIPIGLLMGYFAGKAMTPYLVDSMDTMMKTEAAASANPWIFAFSGLFALITVFAGCYQPARIVSKLSPVEAVRVTGRDGGKKKRAGRVSPISMAKGNIKRTWKKTVAVIISLALPMIILNTIYSVVQGFDFDRFVNTYTATDFKISGCTHNAKNSNLKAITPDVVKAVSSRGEVKTASIAYDTESRHVLNQKEQIRLQKIISKAEKNQMLGDYQLKSEKGILKDKKVVTHIMGINEDAFHQLRFTSKACSWEEFCSGDYVITGCQTEDLGEYHDLGDQVKIKMKDGKEKEYEVLAIGELSYDLQYPFGTGTYFDYTFILPAEEYLSLGGDDTGAMVLGVTVQKGEQKSFDRWLKHYIDKEEKSLYVQSSLSLEEQARGFANKYYLVLGVLCGILLIIGVLNFFNTCAVSIMTRKKELALLEAVGMTKIQIMKMLIAEGLFYLFSAVFIADTLGSFLSLIVIKKTVGRAFFFTSGITITMSLIALPLFLLIAVLIPVYNYRRMSKETVVERLRND